MFSTGNLLELRISRLTKVKAGKSSCTPPPRGHLGYTLLAFICFIFFFNKICSFIKGGTNGGSGARSLQFALCIPLFILSYSILSSCIFFLSSSGGAIGPL